jgi:uncharacterized membrane protein YgdD (TMEM256/DUF423 family)
MDSAMNEEVNFCSQCGSKIKSDTKFCPNCGHDLKNSSTKITSDKTIKVEVTNAKVEVTNVTVEKGFKAIEKVVKAPWKGLKKVFKTKEKTFKIKEKTWKSDLETPSPKPPKSWGVILMLAAGAIFGGISVMLGAMGAHSLKNVLTEKKLSAFQTATEYMGYHGIALILVGIVCLQLPENGSKALKKVGILFTMGILMFSGSLYVLIFDGPSAFGPITPLGVLCFITGWFILAKVAHNHFRKKP